jgi:cytochrome c oxidase subunit 4
MSGNGHSHIASKGQYFAIFGALMVLTIITVAVSQVELGRLNVVVALAVALCKASLVVLYFMHVRYNGPLIKLTAACGFLWLIFMFVITFSDYLTRGWSSALGRSW